MKKFFALAFTLLLCFATCMGFAACDKISIEEISIVAPESTEIRAGETFTLEYTTVPAKAAEKIEVNWEISDESKLSYKDGEFTALTCGKVNVTARVRVKGYEVTDEIKLKVTAPENFKEFSGKGYQLVYPLKWTASKQGKTQIWTATNGTPNMNITTEDLNASYFTWSASSFQAMLESTYELMGFTASFTQPVKVKKETYLDVERVRVEYRYILIMVGTMSEIRQTQMYINNPDANLTCVLTLTFLEEDFNEKREKLQETVFSQFMPA